MNNKIIFILFCLYLVLNCTPCPQKDLPIKNCIYKVNQNYQCQIDSFKSCKILNSTNQVSDYTICSQTCCGYFVPFSRIQHALQTCQGVQISENSNSIVIIALIFSGLIVIGLVIICAYKCWGCCWMRHRSGTNKVVNMTDVTVFELSKPDDLNNWCVDEKYDSLQDCAVCLHDCPNVRLACGHIFHRNCIAECIKRKFQCVLCRSTNLGQVNIHCVRCLQRYHKLHLIDMIGLDQLGESILCDLCLKPKNLLYQ